MDRIISATGYGSTFDDAVQAATLAINVKIEALDKEAPIGSYIAVQQSTTAFPRSNIGCQHGFVITCTMRHNMFQ